jgi:pimeloyl-ACP methyl ester carboxylesterase
VTARESPAFQDVRGHRIAAVHHEPDPPSQRIVVMAHGFKSSKIGPSRYFVPLARSLAARGIAAFRFDQPGSGDSSGDFDDSSFAAWIDTIEHFARHFIDAGNEVALLGQSMGGAATLAAADRLGSAIRGVALWSPGVMLEFDASRTEGEWTEEDGQRVRWDFWREAASVDTLAIARRMAVPLYAVFGTADDYITGDEMRAFAAAAPPHANVRIIEDLPHSAWPHDQRTQILRGTEEFLVQCLPDAQQLSR